MSDGCSKHPQSEVWRRDVQMDGGTLTTDCCGICGDPLDPGSMYYATKKPEPVVTRRTILGWQRHVHAIATSKGWHDGSGDIWKWLGNLIAEAAESWEEARKPDFDAKRTYYDEEGKPCGLGIELADLVIRAMDTAAALGIDLEAAIAEKSSYNETRPMRHGGKRA